MKVIKRKNSLIIEFEYDPKIVAIVGLFLGREFNKVRKYWTVPVSQVDDVVDTLKQLGFSFDDKVLEEYRKKKILNLKINRIKAGKLKSGENELLDSLNVPLFEYQRIGAGYIAAHDGALLGDQPGLGKTIQSLSSTQLKSSKKVLIFCPVSMKRTWQEELEKWFPKETSVIVGGSIKQRTAQWSKDVKFYICNYHLILRDLAVMKKTDWDFIIADEATVLSNRKSKTTQKIKKIPSKKRLALTGTPLNNSVEDIWSIMDWLQPGLLGSYWQFLNDYCIKDSFGSVKGYKNLGKLKDKIGVYMLRRLKKDVLTQLPPKLYENIYIELSDSEKKLYNAIQEEGLEILKSAGMKETENLSKALVKIVRLKQLTSTSELLIDSKESSKLDALKELLSVILANNEKAIIFTSLREVAVILMRELQQYKPLMIAGGISVDERDANRKMFNEDDEHKLLIMTSAGNMGLNLQRASSVIHYDLPWSISALEQREDRAHRQGQTGNVTVYKLLVQNSVDEYILKTLHKKKKTSDAVLGDSSTNATIRKVVLSRADMQLILSHSLQI